MYRTTCGLIATSLVTFAACSRDPATRTREYIASGDAFARAGKYREASVEYRNAIKVTPTSAEAHEKLADAAARAQDPQTAAGAILRVAELKPDRRTERSFTAWRRRTGTPACSRGRRVESNRCDSSRCAGAWAGSS